MEESIRPVRTPLVLCHGGAGWPYTIPQRSASSRIPRPGQFCGLYVDGACRVPRRAMRVRVDGGGMGLLRPGGRPLRVS